LVVQALPIVERKYAHGSLKNKQLLLESKVSEQDLTAASKPVQHSAGSTSNSEQACAEETGE